MSRRLAMACRCQMLTGNFKGNQRSCPCDEPSDCKFTLIEKGRYALHPKVIATRKSQMAEYNLLAKKRDRI